MFEKIMVPVDLAHKETIGRALDCAADMAKRHSARITYLGVTAGTPSSVAHTPAEFAQKLEDFAAGEAERHGVTADSHVIQSHDPTVEMNRQLVAAVNDLKPDLVVMQSHTPGATDYLFEGHGPYLAQHAKTSVMLVRD